MNRSSRQAFTIIELLVAIAVTAVIALFAFQFVRSLVDVWTLANRNLVVETEAQTALDAIATDLQNAFYAENQGVMFAIEGLMDGGNSGNWESGSQRPLAEDFDPEAHRYGWAGSWLRFFTAAPTLNAVGYQIVRRKQSWDEDQGAVYQLFRSVVRADLVAETGYDLSASGYTDTSQTGSENHPITIVKTHGNDHILANIIDFGVRLYVRDELDASPSPHAPTGMRLVYPAENGVLSSELQARAHAGVTGRKINSGDAANWEERFPDAAEVFLRTLDPAGADKLRRLENAGGEPDAAQWNAIVEEHGRLYRRFVEMRSQSL